jgi:hypothetical protein
MESPAKVLMKQIWRFGQVGGMVSVILMCLNLTIPLYEYTAWRLIELGIPGRLDWLIILILFLMVFSMTLIFGFAYDKIFQLWKHREIVAMERNPFMKGRITPNELVTWQYVNIPLLLKNGLKAEAEFNLKWNERNMERDPELRKDVFRIIKYIKDYKLKNLDDRWLHDISEITENKYLAKYSKFKPDW